MSFRNILKSLKMQNNLKFAKYQTLTHYRTKKRFSLIKKYMLFTSSFSLFTLFSTLRTVRSRVRWCSKRVWFPADSINNRCVYRDNGRGKGKNYSHITQQVTRKSITENRHTVPLFYVTIIQVQQINTL